MLIGKQMCDRDVPMLGGLAWHSKFPPGSILKISKPAWHDISIVCALMRNGSQSSVSSRTVHTKSVQ